MNTITKTKDRSNVPIMSNYRYTGFIQASGSATTYADYGTNTITYDAGPRYLNGHPNWKGCYHTKSQGWIDVGLLNATRYEVARYPVGATMDEHVWNVPLGRWASFGLASASTSVGYPTPTPWDDVFDEVYADMAGRGNEYLLSLESLAGLFSGKTLWSAIRGTANAFDRLEKGVKMTKRLARAFGYKKSLWATWTSAKDAIREVLGLRLGYRFGFKATLNDIVDAVDLASSYGRYVRKIAYRNGREDVSFSKTRTVRNSWTDSVSGALDRAPNEFRSALYNIRHMDYEYFPRVAEATVSRRACVTGQVRYPVTYSTVRHYYESAFGLDKPLTTLWAIVPMSFVIDYLVNVQDMLAHVDSKLNDYLVAMNIRLAWALEKGSRQAYVSIPAWSDSHDGTDDNAWYCHTSATKATYGSKFFRRYPISTSSVRSGFPSLISGQQNWITKVGTGIELLAQLRK
jgi:hypothetical protein